MKKHKINPSLLKNHYDNTVFNAKKVPFGFNYSSGENNKWESVDSLRKLISENLNVKFD